MKEQIGHSQVEAYLGEELLHNSGMAAETGEMERGEAVALGRAVVGQQKGLLSSHPPGA